MLDLSGKVALVTGGGGGIGRAIVRSYAQLGAAVVVAERDPDRAQSIREEMERQGVDCLVFVGDVTFAQQVRLLAGEIEARFSRLDILVNNVGDSLGLSKPFADSSEEEWDSLYDINLRHVFLVTHAMLPLLRKAGPGSSVISLSSVEGVRGYPMGVAYSAFKAGIGAFTKSLACELGPEQIRVNAIACETTETEQIQIVKSVKPEHEPYVPRWFPLGRYGRPEDAAGAAVYLASDLAAWVTGDTILVDGGALAQGGWRQMRDGRWTNSPIIAEAHRSYGPLRS